MAEFQRSQRVLSSDLLAQALDQVNSASQQQILEALEGLLATSIRRR